VLPVAGMLLLVMVQAVLNLVTGYVMEGRSRRAMLALFGEYVAPQLVERMARDPRSVRIDSGDKELTILFADIRGFTRMAETMRPEQLREYLNRFLTAMTDVIHRHHGTVDKYIGDAVMAFWGAPIDDPDHADHAVAAALDMQREVARLSDAFAREGLPTLAVGIGLNTGLVRVGDMGSRARRAYTVIGDAVNLAARLEALTKHVDAAGIVAGDATRRAARAHRFESLGLHAVPGRQEPVHAWVPMAATAQAGQGDGAEPARSLLSREQMAAIAASAASAATAASAAARASAAAISPAVAPSVAASPVAVSPAGPPAAPDTAEPGVSAAGAAPR
jgi:adenylate cyclase